MKLTEEIIREKLKKVYEKNDHIYHETFHNGLVTIRTPKATFICTEETYFENMRKYILNENKLD